MRALACAGSDCAWWRRLRLGSPGAWRLYSKSGKRRSQRRAVSSLLGHQPLVDLARGLLAAAHGVGHVGCAGDDVAAGIESGAAGLKREAIDGQRALVLEFQSGGAAEVLVEGFANGEDDAVALEALHLIGGDGAAAAGFVVFAKAGFHDLDCLDAAVRAADDAMRRGEKDKAHALFFGGLNLFVDGGHVFAFAAVEDGGSAAHAQDGARRVDGRVAAADDRDPGAQVDFVVPSHRLKEWKRGVDVFQFSAGQVEPGLFPGADGEEDGVEGAGQFVERKVEADARVEDKFHAHGSQLGRVRGGGRTWAAGTREWRSATCRRPRCALQRW